MLKQPNPPLGDEEIALRPPAQRDLPAIELISRDPDWVAAFGVPTMSPAEMLELNEQRWADGRAATFAISDRSDRCVGHVWLNVSPLDRHRATLGYWLLPSARGKGLATRAVRLVANWALQELGLARLSILTEPSNAPSRRVAELSGFHEEGVLRSYAEVAGERVDYVSYSLLPGDVRAHAADVTGGGPARNGSSPKRDSA